MKPAKWSLACALLPLALLIEAAPPGAAWAQYFDPNEPNDSFAQATTFAVPHSFLVDLDPAGDQDFYKFSGQPGDTVDISVQWKSGTGMSGGLTVELYLSLIHI